MRSDSILLERILLNLVSNAVRYTSTGGIVVGCRRRGRRLRIEVCDSGPGIPEDQRRNIFGEFYRLSKGDSAWRRPGLGPRHRRPACARCSIIPSSSCRRWARARASRVAVPWLPPRRCLPTPPAAAPLSPDVSSGKLVVVIDDDALVLEGMGGLLRNWGCRVVAAGSVAWRQWPG